MISPKKNVCSTAQPIVVTQPRGSLASLVSVETGCGTAHAPWHIRVLAGQHINITLLDFSLPPSTAAAAAPTGGGQLSSSSSSGGKSSGGSVDHMASAPGTVVQIRNCRVYAVVRELTAAAGTPGGGGGAVSGGTTICGGDRHRHKTVYVSQTNSVEIQIVTGNNPAKQFAFLLTYEGDHLNQICDN